MNMTQMCGAPPGVHLGISLPARGGALHAVACAATHLLRLLALLTLAQVALPHCLHLQRLLLTLARKHTLTQPPQTCDSMRTGQALRVLRVFTNGFVSIVGGWLCAVWEEFVETVASLHHALQMPLSQPLDVCYDDSKAQIQAGSLCQRKQERRKSSQSQLHDYQSNPFFT